MTSSLAGTVEARASAVSLPGDAAPPGWRAELVSRLLPRLVSALEERRPDAPNEPPGDVERHVETVRLLRDAVYEAIDTRAPDVSPRQLRFVADWFAAEIERSLRIQNLQYAALLDSIPDHLFMHDVDFRISIVNRAYTDGLRAAGLGPGRIIGRRLIDEMDLPDPFKQYIRGVVGRVAQGESVTQEFQAPPRLGGHWREHHCIPVHDAEGRVTGVAVSSRDIHARKLAEARLQLLSRIGALAATGSYDELVGGLAHLSIPELADWCVVDVVEDCRVRRRIVAHRDPAAQAAAEDILRLAPAGGAAPAVDRDRLCSEPRVIEDLDGPELRECDPQLGELAGRLGVNTAIRVPVPVLGGLAAMVTFVFAPEWIRRHGPEDLELAREVARRAAQAMENARLQDKLRQSEARFRVALSRANISVFEQDSDLRFRWSYNSPFVADDGLVVGKTVGQFMPPDAACRMEAWERQVLETGEGARLEIDFDLAGERRHFLANCEPIRGPRGIAGVTGAIVDITETKRAQEALAQAVAFRERLIGILGHDLRNPLSAVLALARLLREHSGIPDRARVGLDRIVQSAARMNEMIGTILDFTSVRFRGEVPLARETVALDTVASSIVDELRAAHPERTIEIASDGDLRGRWDGGRLGQVLSNLVANALSHGTREAPVRVLLSRDDGGAILAVTNRGPAIPAELKERLFEPFWQGPRDGAPPPNGLGLGLFITREIVRAHGGSIDVRCDGGSTTFTVRLPVEGPAADRPPC
ncbi:MAG TPA: ATP-binding protein [Polyangia bacterium]|nr:ATP-binding protein [Polyangia bacterium]